MRFRNSRHPIEILSHTQGRSIQTSGRRPLHHQLESETHAQNTEEHRACADYQPKEVLRMSAYTLEIPNEDRQLRHELPPGYTAQLLPRQQEQPGNACLSVYLATC